jgi:hypothetical protein
MPELLVALLYYLKCSLTLPVGYDQMSHEAAGGLVQN